jgi:hypothetical protein
MAETTYTVERYENGVLVESQTFTKPTEQVNQETLMERAVAAMTSNADFLALASPTNAQAVAQVQSLTRQVNAIIRLLVVQKFDDISDS